MCNAETIMSAFATCMRSVNGCAGSLCKSGNNSDRSKCRQASGGKSLNFYVDPPARAGRRPPAAAYPCDRLRIRCSSRPAGNRVCAPTGRRSRARRKRCSRLPGCRDPPPGGRTFATVPPGRKCVMATRPQLTARSSILLSECEVLGMHAPPESAGVAVGQRQRRARRSCSSEIR